MILSVFTTIFAAVSIYLGSSVLASSVDMFYIFLMIQISLTVFIKIAHHSSESSVRVDKVGGLFVFFSSSAVLLFGFQLITNLIIFQGV